MTTRKTSAPCRGVAAGIIVALCYRNGDKLRRCGTSLYHALARAQIFPPSHVLIPQLMTIVQFVIHKTDRRMSANVPKYEDNNEADFGRAESHKSTRDGTERLAFFSRFIEIRMNHNSKTVRLVNEGKG